MHVRGDLDIAHAAQLDETLTMLRSQPHAPAVILDLTACTYIDSSILSVLVQTHQAAADRFAIVVPEGNRIRKLLKIASLDTVLTVCDTVDEAASAIR